MDKVIAIPLPYLDILLLIVSLEGRNTHSLYIRKCYSPVLFPTLVVNIINTCTQQQKITYLYLVLVVDYLQIWKEGERSPCI